MFLRIRLKQTGILCLVLGMVAIAGCGFSQAQPVNSTVHIDKLVPVKVTMTENEEAQLVPVSAVTFDGSKISAGVVSFGCTTAADFAIEHAIVNGKCEVRINRVNPDFCRRVPFVANIELDWSQPEDCQDLNIVVANPLLVTSNDNNIKKQIK